MSGKKNGKKSKTHERICGNCGGHGDHGGRLLTRTKKIVMVPPPADEVWSKVLK